MTEVNGEQIVDGSIDVTALDLSSLLAYLSANGYVLTTPSISLIVETGAVVANANSYVTLEETTAYCTARGVSLGSDSDIIITQLIQASDWLNGKEQAFQGKRVSSTQALCWPRKYVHLFDDDVLSTTIPSRIKYAQMELVKELSQGNMIVPTGSLNNIRREKVNSDTELEYFQAANMVALPMIDKLLKPLYRSRGFGLAVQRG